MCHPSKGLEKMQLFITWNEETRRGKLQRANSGSLMVPRLLDCCQVLGEARIKL